MADAVEPLTRSFGWGGASSAHSCDARRRTSLPVSSSRTVAHDLYAMRMTPRAPLASGASAGGSTTTTRSPRFTQLASDSRHDSRRFLVL